jgi:hypothetical protein
MTTWDANFEASPADSDERKYGANKIRELKSAISERLEVEHSMSTGKHYPGETSVFYYGTTANIANLANMSNGAIAQDSNTGELKVYDGGWTVIRDGQSNLSNSIANTVKGAVWPIGSIFISYVNTNPATLIGIGTWVAFGEGKVLIGVDANDADFANVGATGGNKTHTLTANEVPVHNHTVANVLAGPTATAFAPGGTYGSSTGLQTKTSSNAGGGNAHNNLQPYITVYMWRRTA